MDEKSDQIIGHIEARREELGRNLSELEEKVRRKTDLKAHFDRNPMLVLGAALGGGLLVGSLVAGARSSNRSKPWKSASASYAAGTPAASGFASSSGGSIRSQALTGQLHQVSEALEDIKGALIAFGVAKAKEFLTEAVPGLENHLGDFGGKSAAPRGGASTDYRSGKQNFTGDRTSQGTAQQATKRTDEHDEELVGAGVGNATYSAS